MRRRKRTNLLHHAKGVAFIVSLSLSHAAAEPQKPAPPVSPARHPTSSFADELRDTPSKVVTPATPAAVSDPSSLSEENALKGATQEAVAAAAPTAALSCRPSPALILSPVTCTVKIDHSASVTVTMDAPAGGTLLPAEQPMQTEAGMLLSLRRFQLTPAAPYPLEVPPITIRWRGAQGGGDMLTLEGREHPVTSRLIGRSDPRPRRFHDPLGEGIDGPAPRAIPSATSGAPQPAAATPNTLPDNAAEQNPLERPDQPLPDPSPALAEARRRFLHLHGALRWERVNFQLLAALIILVGGLLVGLIAFLFYRQVQRWLEERPEPVDDRPAHEIAFQALRALQATRLLQEGELKRYHDELVHIIRDYFQRRYEISALEMTDEEIRDSLNAVSMSTEARLSVDHFLSDAALIKFAGVLPSLSELDTTTRGAFGLIELTRARLAQTSTKAGEPDSLPVKMTTNSKSEVSTTQGPASDPTPSATPAQRVALKSPGEDGAVEESTQ